MMVSRSMVFSALADPSYSTRNVEKEVHRLSQGDRESSDGSEVVFGRSASDFSNKG